MCELLLCLLLWTAVSRTQGEVTGGAALTVEVGEPLALSCSVDTPDDHIVRQVRWLDGRGGLLLAYEPGHPAAISHRDPGVRLDASHNGSSRVTLEKVRPDDEGCYRCVFDVFPTGRQEAVTCVSVTGKASTEGNVTAVSGQSTALSCSYSLPTRVQQVLWTKTAEQGDTTTVGFYGKHGQLTVMEPFAQRVGLSRSLGDTRLTVAQVRMEDEGCYTCAFHTYPEGSKNAVSCLSIYVLPTPEVSYVTSVSGETEANCTARSRPAADITWDVGGDNRTLGPPVTSVDSQGDGTTVVTSTLLLQPGLLRDVSVKCVVHHRGLRRPLTVPLNTNVGPATIVLLSVCGVVMVLLLCLCVCFCKCFCCTDD